MYSSSQLSLDHNNQRLVFHSRILVKGFAQISNGAKVSTHEKYYRH